MMPSRFTGLAPHSWVQQSPSMDTPWDVYDDVPLDPDYSAPVSLIACTRKPSL